MKRLLTFGLFSFGSAAIIVCLLIALAAVPASAQSVTILASFNALDGGDPEFGPLAQGRDGNFYGATYISASGGCEGVFKVTAAGNLSTVHCFGAGEGAQAYGGVVLGTDGNLYGTAAQGGANAWGTIYKVSSSTGVLTTLYSFCAQPNCADGAFPSSSLVQASNGSFYGVTPPNATFGSQGTIFQITPAGAFKTLYTFCSQPACTDGSYPDGPLIQATDGNLYGVTLGGANGYGTIFRITLAGKLTTLYRFTNQTDGSTPIRALLQASDGNFYGVTVYGGFGNCPNGCGTIFKMTPAGTLTTLHYFDFDDGDLPNGGLVQAADGNFYGTTQGGGCGTSCPGFGGTVFEMAPDGTLTSLHLFSGPPDGSSPTAPLMQSTNGTFYGQSTWGGDNSNCGSVGCGTVFSVDVGLGQFVQALTYSGKVGATIEFLGQGFTNLTTVSFNGAPATPNVISGTYLTVKVPGGATTGFVTITTSSGTLTSNKMFTVVR